MTSASGEEHQTQQIIASGEEHQTQQIINANALPALVELLSHEDAKMVKEACFALSNITAGSQAQVQAVADAGAMPKLLGLMSSGDLAIRKESSWAICNALSLDGSEVARELLFSLGAADPLRSLLEWTADGKLAKAACKGLEALSIGGAILGAGGGE